MTDQKIYGYRPWIKWYGGECPVPPNTRVVVKYRNGVLGSVRRADDYYWYHDGGGGDIFEYRIVLEKADFEAAEQLLRDNGYTVTPPTKPITFEDVEPLTKAPPEGTDYWVVQPFSKSGLARATWVDTSFHEAVLLHRMAYLDKEHALIAARHIYGLKGGEL